MRNLIEFGKVVQEEMSFEDIFIYSSGGLFVQQSRKMCKYARGGSGWGGGVWYLLFIKNLAHYSSH